MGHVLLEKIVKMDCEKCKLRTEHYLLDYGDGRVLCRCLRCGQVTRNSMVVSIGHGPYPADDRRPIYVF